MNYKHYLDRTGNSFNKGELASDMLLDLFLEHPDISMLPSTEEEDWSGHIDYRILYKGTPITLDVKAIKDITKNSPELFTWIEFVNVVGEDGWILGESDYICFELDSMFVMIPRKTILNHCVEHVDFKTSVTDKRKCRYNMYSRKGRDDVMTAISLKKLIFENPQNILKLSKSNYGNK